MIFASEVGLKWVATDGLPAFLYQARFEALSLELFTIRVFLLYYSVMYFYRQV